MLPPIYTFFRGKSRRDKGWKGLKGLKGSKGQLVHSLSSLSSILSFSGLLRTYPQHSLTIFKSLGNVNKVNNYIMKLLNQITTCYTLKTIAKNWNLFVIIVDVFPKSGVVCLKNNCV
ncbi:MAG: hypothetical protein PHQ18_04925 [Patescibacteria group bacterium]|nr:hypothetical protein [Patescibacteria group bacterium]